MTKLMHFLFAIFLVSCQTQIATEDQLVTGSIDLKISDGVLDLSQFSQEQQKIEREEAAKLREELKAGRVVLEANSKEKIVAQSVNLAVFARSVSNNVGEKIYYRNFISIGDREGCKKFLSKNAAQIFFLENGGPKNDFYNIDKDGDGFACNWDPAIYRKIERISKNQDPNS